MSGGLIVESISKKFNSVVALNDVSLHVAPGEVRALLGENGAGKSTLLKILSGSVVADSGRIILGESELKVESPLAGMQAGISIIYQELQLIPELSVAENLFLGSFESNSGVIDQQVMLQRAKELLSRVRLEVDPEIPLGRLPLASQQMVEIARALGRDSKIIAFDEPTSSLGSQETERLFELIRELKSSGKVILYVSHRLSEIFKICDSATVLRDGNLVADFPMLSETDVDSLVSSMVGRKMEDFYHYRSREISDEKVIFSDIFSREMTQPASFQVHKGEIVGIYGLIGAGRSELLRSIFGVAKNSSGTVQVSGKDLRCNLNETVAAGVAFCPEERKSDGIIASLDVQTNLNLVVRKALATYGVIVDDKAELNNTQEWIEKLRIKTSGAEQSIRDLSGGNQQKVILARWLSHSIDLLLLDEPTRGIDVGTKSEIYQILFDLAENGLTVLFVSSDLSEVLGVSDRIIVMREGAISGSISRAEATEESILKLALPVS